MARLAFGTSTVARVTDRPFHHGNLRAELLDRAEVVLRERGIDALSLRELARDAGVSHGAPRSHFVDRQALLDALAERGFLRLIDEVTTARAQAADDHVAALRAVGAAYLDFAVDDPALVELMFAAKAGEAGAVPQAAERLVATMTDLVQAGIDAGVFVQRDPQQLTLLMSAMVQGLAALVGSHRVPESYGDTLLDGAVKLFTKA